MSSSVVLPAEAGSLAHSLICQHAEHAVLLTPKPQQLPNMTDTQPGMLYAQQALHVHFISQLYSLQGQHIPVNAVANAVAGCS